MKNILLIIIVGLFVSCDCSNRVVTVQIEFYRPEDNDTQKILVDVLLRNGDQDVDISKDKNGCIEIDHYLMHSNTTDLPCGVSGYTHKIIAIRR
jgi:hypothetical protein